MLDTIEQLTGLDDWVCDLARLLHPNVPLVIAGRRMPDWSRTWPGWLAQTHAEELKLMTEDIMRTLIRRYYATMRGGEPEPKQMEAVIEFARGLPLVVTTAVRLWVDMRRGFRGGQSGGSRRLGGQVEGKGAPDEMTSYWKLRRRCAGSTRRFCVL